MDKLMGSLKPQQNKAPNLIESVSSPENYKTRIENHEKFGNVYTSLIKNLIGEEINNPIDFGDERQQFVEVEKTIKNFQNINQKRFEEMGSDVKTLLKQVKSFNTVEKHEIIEKGEGISFEKINEGVFIVKILNPIFTKLHGVGAQAFAFTSPEKTQFIALRHYEGEKYDSVNKNRYEINVPHEFHHIVWSNLMAQEKIIFREESNIEDSLVMFQNEAIAHIVSDDRPFGYPIFNLMEEDEKEEYEKNNPGKIKEIRDICFEINENFREISSLMRNRGIPTSTYMKPVMMAKNFEELKENLIDFKKMVESQPIIKKEEKEENISHGWCSIESD